MSFATRSGCVALVLAALCPTPGQAVRHETAAGSAQAVFMHVAAPRFVPGQPGESVPGKAAFTGAQVEPPVSAHPLSPSGQVKGAQKPVAEINLASQYNRHFKTSISYKLGGKDIWISGSFDRDSESYVVVMEQGKEARFFQVMPLLTKPVVLDLGTEKYRLSIMVDASEPLESQIVLTNVVNRKEQHRNTLSEMLAALSETGAQATVGGIAYRVFYSDDIKENVADPSVKSFVFIHTDDKGENSVFMIKPEEVPADKIATFKMLDNKIVGLRQADGKLLVYDNPK